MGSDTTSTVEDGLQRDEGPEQFLWLLAPTCFWPKPAICDHQFCFFLHAKADHDVSKGSIAGCQAHCISKVPRFLKAPNYLARRLPDSFLTTMFLRTQIVSSEYTCRSSRPTKPPAHPAISCRALSESLDRSQVWRNLT